MQQDERWSKAEAVAVAVDPNDPARAQVRARFDGVEAVKAFRDEIGTNLLTGEVPGLSVSVVGER